MGMKHVKGMPYHPQCQGKVERENRVVKSMLNKAVLDDVGGLQPDEAEMGTAWAMYVPQICALRNATPRRSLQGQTPYLVLRKQHSPLTLAAAGGAPMAAVDPVSHALLVSALAESQRKAKMREVDARAVKKKPTVFEVGDKVFVCARPDAFCGKLIAKWSHFAVVTMVNLRRNSYIVRFLAGGGPYGEDMGAESKLLPAKRLKLAAVTVNNESFCRAMRLPRALAESADAAAAATRALVEEDDLNEEALMEEEEAEAEADERPDADIDGAYDSQDDEADMAPSIAGTTRASLPATVFSIDAEYLFSVTDDQGVVTEVSMCF